MTQTMLAARSSTAPDPATRLRRISLCLALLTAGVAAAAGALAFLVPADFYNQVLRLELWHAPVTAALLFWVWQGGALPRFLVLIALGMAWLYVAPLSFLLLLAVMEPAGIEKSMGDVGLVIAYFGVLVVYYTAAFLWFGRAYRVVRLARGEPGASAPGGDQVAASAPSVTAASERAP